MTEYHTTRKKTIIQPNLTKQKQDANPFIDILLCSFSVHSDYFFISTITNTLSASYRPMPPTLQLTEGLHIIQSFQYTAFHFHIGTSHHRSYQL